MINKPEPFGVGEGRAGCFTLTVFLMTCGSHNRKTSAQFENQASDVFKVYDTAPLYWLELE